MPSPLKLTGAIASRGFAEGPLLALRSRHGHYQPSGHADTEAAALRAAIAAASTEVAMLMAAAGADGADMLEFQLAMLEDEALSAPAFEDIDSGDDAETAWGRALAAQVAIYEAADDDYFRARASDLRDIRDRVLRVLSGAVDAPLTAGAILTGEDITPSQFLAADWSKGGAIVLSHGSGASHVAMLARARGVPMLVGVAGLPVGGADLALVDAEEGAIAIAPDAAAIARFRERKNAGAQRLHQATLAAQQAALTRDGTAISVNINVAQPSDVANFDVANCDGVGLMRTEFLFANGLPDEESQYRAYRQVLQWAGEKPVVIRTVDAGGDKPVPGFTVAETNPFLGLRGIRLALSRPDVFRLQIRALLRAAVHGNLKVMFPMVAVPGEYQQARTLFEEEATGLSAAGIAHRLPPLGIMVEVPSVAIAPEGFADVAFFSIGSNDLTQYVMAAGRDNGAVAALNDVTNPAVLALIRRVVEFGTAHHIPVSLCGDAGGDPAAIPSLLATGLRSVSVAPAQLGFAKLAIASLSL